MTIGTRLFTWFNGRVVGHDSAGNTYYEDKRAGEGERARRWVMFTGAAVLLAATVFLGYAVANTGRATVSGMTLRAKFDRIDGLAVGADVRLAGVRVGSVTSTSVDPASYQAVVVMSVQPGLKLPRDSSAEISSDGLVGGKSLAIVPGGEDKFLANGGEFTITQSAASLEQLLGKFIFGVGELSSNVQRQLDQNKPAAKP